MKYQDLYTRGEAITPAPFYIWGIVNSTPDSFFDGGKCAKVENALSHARKLWEEGASILDIGGASSRPGSAEVSAEEEWQRIEAILLGVKDFEGRKEEKLCSPYYASFFETAQKPLISVDTWRADVAQKALELGVEIINDISAFAWEPSLKDIVAEHKPCYVLMHCQGMPKDMQNSPQYKDVVADVYAFFEEKMEELVRAGLPEKNIILDLGFGFGKTVEHNIKLLQNIEIFSKLDRPLLQGISNKSIFGALFDLPTGERGTMTQIATSLSYGKGVYHHRVHDVTCTAHSLAWHTIVQNGVL